MNSTTYCSVLLSLLGYTTVPSKRKGLDIINKEGDIIGHIQWKKFKKKKEEKPAEYGIKILLDSDTIFHKGEQLEKNFNKPFNFSFKIKEKDGTKTKVILNTTDIPSLTIRKTNGEYINVFVDHEKLYIEEKTSNKENKIHETTIYKWKNHNIKSSLIICTKYFDKELDYRDLNLYSPLSIHETIILESQNGHTKILKEVTENGIIVPKDRYYVDDMKDGMSNDNINFAYRLRLFRNKINSIIPFNQDVFNILFANVDFPLKEHLFPTTYTKEEIKSKSLKPKETK